MFKKLMFLLLLFPTWLLSKNYAVSIESIETLWNQQAYVKACDIANKFYQEHPYDITANLYYGKCALYKDNVDEAMAAYDRAEILDDTNALVHQYLGDLYAKIGNFEIAKGEYDKADRFGNAPVSRALLSEVDPHHLSLLLRLSAGSDSNVQYSADDLYSESKPESAWFAKEYLRVNHVYDVDPFSSFYYKSQLQIYNKNYETFHDDDLFQADIKSGVGWGTNTFDLWLPLHYGRIAIGYESYADIYGMHPQLRKRFENRVLMTVEAGYEYQRYLQWSDGDKLTYSGKFSLSRWFGSNYFRIGYGYEVTEKEDAKSQFLFIDKDFSAINFDYVRSLTQSLEAGLGYYYRLSHYDDRVSGTSGAYREDKLQQYSAYISYDLDAHKGLLFQYNHYDNTSNYLPSQYKKNVFSGGIYFYY